MLYDAFICHASEDKPDFVRSLAEELSKHNLHIWYDEFSLSVGDSLNQAIDQGLSKSTFGIVVLSPDFFKKGWARRELDGLVARQVHEDRRLILPIWHNVTAKDILEYSPTLADTIAIQSSIGMHAVCRKLLKKLRPEASPMIAARDELIRRGIDPPVISDEWWLDIVEASNRILDVGAFIPPESTWGTWTFPLPYKYEVGAERGLNLAWTAMQIEWSEYAEKNNICQITHPDTVHKFISDFPGLSELSHQYPDYVASYAPQLLIPEFSRTFGSTFEHMLSESEAKLVRMRKIDSNQGRGLTIDKNLPLCDKEIALRHPTFGNYEPASIACFYVQGEMWGPSSKCFEKMDYVVWFLSHHSHWLPKRYREFLIVGMREWTAWASFQEEIGERDNPFVERLFTARTSKKFRFTKKIRLGLEKIVNASLNNLNLEDSVERITDEFIDRQFIEGYFDRKEKLAKRDRR